MNRLRLAFAAAMSLAACDGGDTTGSGGTGASSGTTTDTSTGGTTSTADTGGGGSTSMGGGGTGGTPMGGGGTGGTPTGGGGAGGATTTSTPPLLQGVCGRRCMADADCCPPGAVNCPGPYPSNYTCADMDGDGEKTCRPPECSMDSQCPAVTPTCKPLQSGVAGCIKPCMNDAECPGQSKCVGTAMDGTKYCIVPTQPFMCTPGEVCPDYGTCNASGDGCYCTSDDECADANYEKDCVNKK